VEYVALAISFGLSAGVIGKIKGSSFWIWFAVGLVLPIIGTIAAICWRWEGREALRQCPECGNVVPLHDQVCMRCGRDLEFPEPSGQAG
jgi:rRNA maturation protein Nop10